MAENNPLIKVTKNGPYMVSGSIPLKKGINEAGKETVSDKWEEGEDYPEQKNYALCSCGQSKKKPYCDGSHIPSKFSGEYYK